MEQTLAPGGICCLGSINLTQFINEDRTDFDYKGIKKTLTTLVRFLDNVNSYSNVPLQEYKNSMESKRRIGCGILGWGSALYMLKVRFASEKAAELRLKLIKFIAQEAYKASIDLAEEKGKFPLCEPEKHAQSPFVQNIELPEEYLNKLRTTGIRNSALLSCQPTGNGSIYANLVSGGIEPIFMPEYIRTKIETHTPEHLLAVTPKWQEGQFVETEFFKLSAEGDDQILVGTDEFGVTYKIDKNRGLTREVLCQDYGVRYLRELGEWDTEADWAVTSMSITTDEHLEDLQIFAKYVDSAISKTILVEHDYPFEEFENVYLRAYRGGYVKGLTTYRSGTMASVLSVKEEKENILDEEIILDEIKLPDSLPCTLKTLKAEGRKWYLTLIRNEAQTRPVALFCYTNSAEKNTTANDAVEKLHQLAILKGIPDVHINSVLRKVGGDSNTTKICRFISLNLRHGVLVRNIVSTLDQVDCIAGSFVFHIRKFLAGLIKDGEAVPGQTCESCGAKDSIVYQEGCKICRSCGSSKCG